MDEEDEEANDLFFVFVARACAEHPTFANAGSSVFAEGVEVCDCAGVLCCFWGFCVVF